MPIYEYICRECGARFEKRRMMAEADEPIACPSCESWESRRAISLFSAVSGGKVVAGPSSSCTTCSSSTCAGCTARR